MSREAGMVGCNQQLGGIMLHGRTLIHHQHRGRKNCSMGLLAGQSSVEYTRSRIQTSAYQGKGVIVILIKGGKTVVLVRKEADLRKQTGDVL